MLPLLLLHGKNASAGADDFYLDLLFYHRHLRRLVAEELKLEKFQPTHKGQMKFYLRWLEALSLFLQYQSSLPFSASLLCWR